MPVEESVTLRLALQPITPQDEPFLRQLYATTREAELRLTGWDDEQKAAFVAMQFDAQHRYYQAHYAGARFDLILRDGEPVGRLYVARWPQELRIMDIALLPGHRGQGIGSRLLGGLLDEGRAAGIPVTIHVEQFNPARRLYERLGFCITGDFGIYYLLSRAPTSP